MASISLLVPPPVSEVEWKPFDITVRVTYSTPIDSFNQGTFYVNLKYGGNTVWTETRSVSGITPAPFPQYLDETFTIGNRYLYSGAEVEAIFDPNVGVTSSTSAILDIVPNENRISKIAAGANHSAAVHEGRVIAWGLNNHGQCDVRGAAVVVVDGLGGRS